ncbi:MAG: glycosyltransferase family 4 protein [Bacteroidetes bacterium]|nr:glycosyltransferase family 4 protein [Bacteroidota bacterium]
MGERKKILIITYYWPPSGGSGVQRWLKFVKYLPQFGFDPVVITVDETYASYPLMDETLLADVIPGVPVHKTKSREPFNVYRRISGKKKLPHSGFSSEQKPGLKDRVFRFIRGNFFIPDPRRGWNKYAYHTAEKLIDSEQISFVITTGPPHSTHLVGLRLKNTKGVNWIADMRDPWTDIYYYKELKHTQWALKKDARYERSVLEQATGIITVSEGLKELFAAKSAAVDPDKIYVIPNGYDTSDFEGIVPEPKKADEWVISYVGNLSDNYRLETLAKALAKLSRDYAAVKIRLILVGQVSAHILDLFKAEKIEANVTLMGYVPHKQAVAYMKQADALFLVIPDVPNNRGILTGKLFEYLAVKKPVVFVGPTDGDAAAIIRTAGNGGIFGYTDETGLHTYMNDLVKGWLSGSTEDFTSAGADLFSRKNLTGQLAEILRARLNQ